MKKSCDNIYSDLLIQFKRTIGDFNSVELDDYYLNFLQMARNMLLAEDISVEQLNGDLGCALTILLAKALMNNEDIATNPTITFLRSQLSLMTKGDRHSV